MKSTATLIAERAVENHAAQKVGELAELVQLVEQLEPSTIVEIGSMHGGTLRAWKEAAPAAFLVSISLTDGPYGGGTVPGGMADVHLDSDSHQVDTLAHLLRILDGRQADFLFIDGDHSYDGVRKDFLMYAPLVRHGGIVAFHDILPHDDGPDNTTQVKRLWDELVETYQTTEFTEPEQTRNGYVWGGIGVVHV